MSLLLSVFARTRAALADDTEVAFDLASGRFSTPLPFMKPVKVVVHAPDRTQLKVEYWRRNGDDNCAASRGKEGKVVELSAVPAGDVANGERKLTFTLAPLSVGFAYCFRFDARRRTALLADQVKVIEQAVFDSLKAEALRLASAPAASPGPFGAYVDRVVATIGRELSGTFGVAALYDGPGVAGQSLASMVTSTYLTDRPLRDELAAALGALYNSYRPLALVAEKGPVYALSAGPLVYEPIRHLDAIRARLRKPTILKIAKLDTSGDDNALLAALYQKPAVVKAIVAELENEPVFSYADAEQIADLKGFILATSQPRKVVVSRYSIALLKNEVGQVLQKALPSGQIAEDTSSALATFVSQSTVSFNDAAAAGWPRVGPSGDEAFVAMRLAGIIKKKLVSHSTLGSVDALLTPRPAWKLFVARLELETALNVGALPIPEVPPSTSEAFPAYIGVDVGVALVGLPDRSSVLGVAAPMQYFGVSLMPSAIDKNDEVSVLTSGWRQLLSLNLGVEVLRPSYVSDYGVKGVLADRLLLMGVGLRLTTYIRISAGTVIYSYKNPSPLSDEDPTPKLSPYASMSLDFDTFGAISGKYKSM